MDRRLLAVSLCALLILALLLPMLPWIRIDQADALHEAMALKSKAAAALGTAYSPLTFLSFVQTSGKGLMGPFAFLLLLVCIAAIALLLYGLALVLVPKLNHGKGDLQRCGMLQKGMIFAFLSGLGTFLLCWFGNRSYGVSAFRATWPCIAVMLLAAGAYLASKQLEKEERVFYKEHGFAEELRRNWLLFAFLVPCFVFFLINNYLATITGISSDYYEAAQIDGANIYQQIWYITVPLLKPTFIILLLYALGGIMKGQFELFYQLVGNNGTLFSTTDIFDTYVYRITTTQPLSMGMGTSAGLLVITLTAYVISRKEFKYRNTVSFLIYFTTICGGGLIPWYLMYANVLGLRGTTLAIWFPALMTPFLVILMRTFIVGAVPDAVVESAKIDGAGHWIIFWKIVLPVLGPGLATVGLFQALGYWNDWYRASMFSTNSSTWSLQFYLYDLVNSTQAMKQMAQYASVNTGDLPTQSVKLAMAVVATGPVLLLYPFVQRYFVSGITVGAVKG